MSSKYINSLGVCIGASSVSAVWAQNRSGSIKIEKQVTISHHGNPKSVIKNIFSDSVPDKIAVTGRKFRSLLNLTSIPEPEAIEKAFDHLKYSADLIVSAGGENFIAYELDSKGKISKSITGNKCASGTGEFFLQQIKRMDLPLEEAVELGTKGSPYEISGRCSVFCKSDCTHALNKGIPKTNVVAGLSQMMAQKVIELTAKTSNKNVLFIGGVSKNKAMMKFIRDSFSRITIPDEAPYFEALGAALYAFDNSTLKMDYENLMKHEATSFTFHEDLKKFAGKVSFKKINRSIPVAGDKVILGLDVGSTTTKAVLLRISDSSIIAAEYLRTSGDPVAASVACYKSVQDQLTVPVKIIGLGVTGSGRYIAGLHAQTKGIINEIIAHAAATVYFDKDVDTIFEIGGQDAKYTYITAGVPSDYAMNEACSAGTGSFLEESAKETLNIDFTQIGGIALQADRAPNFNDQCSAFISSDIKNALHEGLTKEEIVAGLVYSICLNYTNRVKGNRPVGKKVFMQGGVCYNKAVPIAMAALTGKEIIVPPEPGLMGAFGVALVIKKKLELNFIEEKLFDLEELISRKVEYGKSFICAGGTEKCDRKCSIAIINLNGKKYPFGGACNKYYNLQSKTGESLKRNNLIKLRQDLVFEKYIHPVDHSKSAPTIGIPKSFLTNTLYPLFYNFFEQLGFKVILGSKAVHEGTEMKQAPFCYPAELAHGFLQNLIDKDPDYIFIPHILEIHNPNSDFHDKNCVLLQSENYYLRTAFKEKIKKFKILSPVLNFSEGYETAKKDFLKIAKELGKSKPEAVASFDFAVGELNLMFDEFDRIGEEVIKQVEEDKDAFAIVLFGRSYNAFADEANLGVPQKFYSRNVTIIPHDFLPSKSFESLQHTYWGMGRQLLRSARYVKQHPQLFAAYITNFSCGPDSFIIGYFRSIMGEKPSLTLELDSHSADAGLNTRIEAFLDITKSYRQINTTYKPPDSNGYKPLIFNNAAEIIDSGGNMFSLQDPSVKVIIPSMGKFGTEAFSAAFRYCGINSEPLPVYTHDTLKMGRGNSTCKECLPLILTAGSMLEYYIGSRDKEERTLFFMAEGDGPCRFGQYHVFLNELIKKRRLENVGIFTLSDEKSYDGLGQDFDKRGWTALLISDIFQNIFYASQAISANKNEAESVIKEEWLKIIHSIEIDSDENLYLQLTRTSEKLSGLEKICTYAETSKVAISGEIFVRNDEFSRVDLMEKLAEQNIIAKIAPISEYVHYSNYLLKTGNSSNPLSLKEKFKFLLREKFQSNIEKKVKRIFARSGFYEYEFIEIDEVINKAKHLIDPALAGEAIVTVGSALHEILDNVSGVISIGPFSCMPSRVAEAILNVEMNMEGKKLSENKSGLSHLEDVDALPYLAIETDGNLYPQIIQSRIEIFIMQAQRLHKKLLAGNEEDRVKHNNVMEKFIQKIGETNFYTHADSHPSNYPEILPGSDV